MKFLRKYGGIALMLLGVAVLAALHLTGFTIVNQLLLVPLVLILAGLILSVWSVKRESRY